MTIPPRTLASILAASAVPAALGLAHAAPGPVTLTTKPAVIAPDPTCAARRVRFEVDVVVEEPEPGLTVPSSVAVRWVRQPASVGATAAPALVGPPRTLPLATGALAPVVREEMLAAGLSGTETLIVTYRGRDYASQGVPFGVPACR